MNLKIKMLENELWYGGSVADAMLAPVIEKGEEQRQVLLPEGKWLYLGKTEYDGGKAITVDAPLDVLPYFIKK